METKLSVNNLRVSFRTNNGKVQAVRNISFKLKKGETLAIVGESGSGKSVTARAMLGILAPNAIVESGEIIYDGQDLLKITEENFHSIRGDKIAMIFQDPMSSLNPIMKIGKQLTEAMLLKGSTNQKASRKDFNSMLKNLLEFMNMASGAQPKSEKEAENRMRCETFNKFEYKHTELELAYNLARSAAEELIADIDYLLFTIEKDAVKDFSQSIAKIISLCKECQNDYVVKAEHIDGYVLKAVELRKAKAEQKKYIDIFNKIKDVCTEALKKPIPNFFAMGYWLAFHEHAINETDIEKLNTQLRRALDDEFMTDFIANAQCGIECSFRKCVKNKVEAVEILKKESKVLAEHIDDKKNVKQIVSKLILAVQSTIDELAVHKDSLSYTFHSSIKAAVDFYYKSKINNSKQQKKYDKAMAKYNKLKEKGKNPDWKVPPANIVDLELAKSNILDIINRVVERYSLPVVEPDFHAVAVSVIDYLKDKASGVVRKITRRMAKMRAIKLLDEVGIAEPRRRYNQYPFEFSGGMRQRIVIAIALAANPDILICDEPTTALDVTIQSQILELINKIKTERQLSIIFITHDLGVVANMSDKVAVMYAGKIVEFGTDEDIFYDPKHPYTWALLSSMPDLDTREKLEAIQGTPPNMIYPPIGDAFAPRNKYAMQIDFEQEPPMVEITDTHYAATWLLHPDAAKVDVPQIIKDRISRYKGGARDAAE